MVTAFDQYFHSLKGKKIAVFGLGVSNRPLVRLLLEFGCDVLGCDRTPREQLDEEVLSWSAGAVSSAWASTIWTIWRRIWCSGPPVCTPAIRRWKLCGPKARR